MLRPAGERAPRFVNPGTLLAERDTPNQGFRKPGRFSEGMWQASKRARRSRTAGRGRSSAAIGKTGPLTYKPTLIYYLWGCTRPIRHSSR